MGDFKKIFKSFVTKNSLIDIIAPENKVRAKSTVKIKFSIKNGDSNICESTYVHSKVK